MENIEVVLSGLTISEEDKRSVLQLATELDRRWNQRDAVAFAELFAIDGDFRFHTGAWIKGKASIEAFWKGEVFPGLPEGMRHVVITKRVRFITDNVAIGDGTLRLIDVSEGQERVHLETEGTLIAVKKNARWCISAIRLTALAPE
jgi:uncharacterized protein (TIGR02246 family)